MFRESRVVDEVWAGVAPRALAGEALLIVLDNFEYDVVVASQAAWNGVGAPRNTPVEIIDKLNRDRCGGEFGPTRWQCHRRLAAGDRYRRQAT